MKMNTSNNNNNLNTNYNNLNTNYNNNMNTNYNNNLNTIYNNQNTNYNNNTKNIFDFDANEMLNLMNQNSNTKDFEKSSESFYKEDKFFMTRSNINKNTSININKIFFPDKYKKKSEKEKKIIEESMSFNNKNKSTFSNINDTFNFIDVPRKEKNPGPKKKLKIYPINYKSITEKKEHPPVKSNFTKSLNKELSRISIIYGNNNSMKKFTDNLAADKAYENKNFDAYEIAKQKEFQKVGNKKKLKPLNMKDTSLYVMSKNLFYMKDIKNTVRTII